MYSHQYNPYAANVEIVKGYLKNGRTLILGILYLLSIAVSVKTIINFASPGVVESYTEMLRSMGIDPSNAVLATSSPSAGVVLPAIFSTAISSFFTLLTAIGFIVMFVKSCSRNPDSNPSGGAGILRVISLISFIVSVIGVILLIGLFVVAYFFLDYFVNEFNVDSQTALTLWIASGVLILIFGFFYLFYAASCKNFYRSIKWSLSTVDLHTKGAVAYGVFNIIGAVFIGFGLIGSVISMITTYSTSTLTSTIASALSFFSCVMTASFALGYNGYIKREKLSYSAPHDGGPTGAYYPTDFNNAPNPYAAPQNNQNYQDSYSEYNNAPQHSPAYCPNCGARIDSASPFCSNCGNKL